MSCNVCSIKNKQKKKRHDPQLTTITVKKKKKTPFGCSNNVAINENHNLNQITSKSMTYIHTDVNNVLVNQHRTEEVSSGNVKCSENLCTVYTVYFYNLFILILFSLVGSIKHIYLYVFSCIYFGI